MLVVSDGKREREWALVDRMVVGRDPNCEISHDDPLLSRRHAEFLAGGDQVRVRDLGSRNGIFVNGTKAAERALRPGDVVQIGPLRVRYVITRAPVEIAPERFESDATVVLQSPPPRAPAPPPAADDDDMTRLVHAPFAVPSSSDASGLPDVDILSEEDEPTRFIPADRFKVSLTPVPPPVPPPEPPPVEALPPDPGPLPAVATPVDPGGALDPPVQEHSLTTFVFLQLGALVAVVLLSAALPFAIWRRSPSGGGATFLGWLGVAVVVAGLAVYFIATIIARRLLAARKLNPPGPTTGLPGA
jgi:predicted component of type VI protein secretion system